MISPIFVDKFVTVRYLLLMVEHLASSIMVIH